MELKLEMIVETLLVGAMVSLLVLSFIFFVFGHIWNVPVMRRFFDTLFGERGPAQDKEARQARTPERPAGAVPEAVAEGSDESSRATVVGGRRAVREKMAGEGSAGFGRVLLLALLYGLGVIAEAGSHFLQHPANDETKCKSFQAVAESRLRSGLATRRLARFISDYDACEALSHKEPKHPSSLCAQLKDRVSEFYYNAKNAVFQQREYHEELSGLEARIAFMHSFQTLTWLLFWELSIVFVIAGIAEAGHTRFDRPWQNLMTRLFSPPPRSPGTPPSWRNEWFDAATDLGHHWVNIAAFHILLLVLGCAGLYMLSSYAAAYSEEQFAKRVFGYYLTLTEPQVQTEGAAGAGAEDRDATPESPYHLFSLPDPQEQGPRSTGVLPAGAPLPPHAPQPQRRLEPSAVQILGESSLVLVASDQGGTEPFWVFTLSPDGTRLEHPRSVPIDGPLDLSSMGTIESLSAFRSFAGDACWTAGQPTTYHVFAGPNALGPDLAYVLSLCLEADRSTLKIDRIERQPLESPCRRIFEADRCNVEGMAFRNGLRGEREVLLGIQSAGQRSTVAIVRMRWNQEARRWAGPEQILPAQDSKCSTDATLNTMLTSDAGISDLATAPSGRVYVTTSTQRDDASSGGRAAGRLLPRVPQVGGALWLVDLGCDARDPGDPCRCSAQKATLLETFIHKPDGVSHDNGSVLIVFDDEARRKSVQWAPATFPLGQNEAVFAVIPSPEFK